MSYTPFHEDWKPAPDPSTPVTDTALEHIEQGLVDAHAVLDALDSTYIRGTVSETPPSSPAVGDLWFGPATGGSTPPPSALDTMSGLLARWEVNKLTTANGTEVLSFAPTTGTWTSPLTATAGTAPTMLTAGLNGRKALSFNGTDEFIELDHADITSASTIFIVCNLQTAGGSGGRAVTSMTSTNYRTIRLASDNTNGGILTSGSTPNSVYDSWTSTSGWRVLVGVFDGASSRFYRHKRTGLTGTTNLVTQADLRLGRGPGASTEYSRIDIADLAIVGRACTDAEVKTVLDELAATYGQTLGA